jgi:hypothetical protein
VKRTGKALILVVSIIVTLAGPNGFVAPAGAQGPAGETTVPPSDSGSSPTVESPAGGAGLPTEEGDGVAAADPNGESSTAPGEPVGPAGDSGATAGTGAEGDGAVPASTSGPSGAEGGSGKVVQNVKTLNEKQATRVVKGSIGAAVSSEGDATNIEAEGDLSTANGGQVKASGEVSIDGEQTNGSVDVKASTPARGGMEFDADVKAGAGVNPGKPLTGNLAVTVGNEITGPQAFNAGYQTAVQTILTRQRPGEAGLPTQVRQGLEEVGKLNKDGKLDGTVQINVDKNTAVSNAVAGAQQGIVDTPFLRVFQRRGRPGFVRIRRIIANRAGPRLAGAASDSIDRLEDQATDASNGMVVFNNGPVGRTGAQLNLSGQGVEANVGASVNNFNTFQRSFGRGRRR